jgi:hypothetical protein
MSEQRNKHHVPYTAIEQLQLTFPIHVNNDTVVISHPGWALSGNEKAIQKAGLDKSRYLTVPQFFGHSYGHVYSDDNNSKASIRDYLGNGKRLVTPSEAEHIGSYVKRAAATDVSNAMLHTLDVRVASYRDPECTATVEDLYITRRNIPRLSQYSRPLDLLNVGPVSPELY